MSADGRERAGAAGDRFGAGPMPVAARAVPGRVVGVDLARGVALLAMFVYHFSFDLAFFGFVDWDVTGDPVWRNFAVAIAASFLFLSGVSLVLAHGAGIRWRAFGVRLAVLVAAAGAVTVATVFAMPGAPVFFGILHAIALFSVLGLPFLRLPVALTLAVAAAVLALPHLVRVEALSGLAFVWLGLDPAPPPMVDHEPLFPWFAATLAGIAAGRLALARGLPAGAFARPRGRAGRLLSLLGRNSLLVYLAHQPVFFALLLPAAWLWVAEPEAPPVEASFRAECERTCGEGGGREDWCEAVCACLVDRTRAAGLFEEMRAMPPGAPVDALEREVAALSRACVVDLGGVPPEPDGPAQKDPVRTP